MLATYAPEFVRDDRRRGVNFGTSNREETVDALLAGNNVGLGNRDFTTMEVIGDNFALGEFRMSHDDGFELVYLLAAEQDDDGRLRRATNFDLEDRDQASALLSEWAAERDGNAQPPTNAMTRTLETFPAVYAAGDWDEFAAGYADPAMVVDDRRAGVSAGIVPGRDAVMELVHGLHDVGFQKVTNVPMAVRGEGLALFRRVWHNPEGFDLPMLVLVEAAPSGLVGYQIMWDVEDLDTAMAELDRRFAEVETWSTNLSNAATRILAPYPEKFAARDWEWIGDMIDEHAVSDDRRTAVSGGVVIGRPAIVKLTQGLEDVGFTTMSEQPIAIRGDRLVLTIRTWHDPHGFDLPLLALMEFTDAGPMISNIMWDLEDLDTAYAEMDRLYLDGEGAPHAEVLDPLCYRFIHCYNTRDWAALATPPFGPDTVLVDHRPASYGEMLGIDQLVEYLETMLGLVPDLTVRATEIPAVSATGTVFRMLGNGHTADGGEVEFEVLNCTVIVDGVVRSETFSGDQLDVAIARFTELTNGG